MLYRKYFKRIFDIVISLLALPFVFLATLFIAPLIWLEDKGSIFYNAPRLGKDGKVFIMYKFRTMYMNVPDIRNDDGTTYNGVEDKRVTKVGKVLRKTSLDEIPQFLNVLKGDMSLVGPRPNLATIPYENLEAIQRKRVEVKPGITGFNQAYYRNSIEPDERLRNDLIYVDNLRFLLDLKILFHTVLSVLRQENVYIDKTVSTALSGIPLTKESEKNEV